MRKAEIKMWASDGDGDTFDDSRLEIAEDGGLDYSPTSPRIVQTAQFISRMTDIVERYLMREEMGDGEDLNLHVEILVTG